MKNYQTKLTAISAGLLALLLVFAPLSSFAKTVNVNANVNASVKQDKPVSVPVHAEEFVVTTNASGSNASGTESKGNAFGHLIAPGWFKKNGTSTRSFSWLPAGIARMLGLGSSTGTSTADTTAPVISSVVSTAHVTDASILWMTNERSNSTVFYGTSSADISSSTVANVTKNSLVKSHSVSLSGLTASTTYYFKVGSKDAAGNVSYSPVMSFTTVATPVATTNLTITNVALAVGTSTITANWTTNEPATSKVYYGAGTGVNTNSSSTSFVGTTTLSTSLSVTVTGLATSTLYSLVAQSTNASGSTTQSSNQSVITGI